MNEYSIIIPAFNEAASIIATISEISRSHNAVEVIVVDDGSTDGTYDLAASKGVTVIRHDRNQGYGASLKSGIRRATHDTIVITDADGTYPNRDIPHLASIFFEEGCDMVVGARTGEHAKIPLIRRPAKWLITKLASVLADCKIPDLNSGLRVMRKSVVERFIHLLPNGFSFTSTITLAMLTNNYSVKYFPIDYFAREGKSKIRPIHDTLSFFQLIIRMVLYFDPLRIFLPISLPLILAGGFMIAYQAIVYHNIGTIAVIIIIAGIQLLAIGMLADLIDKRIS